ncbi:MAG: hypothetical protein M1812_005175 [Candelaria pacifica]|nr:MAG: hypothetical protein M1812_005175 [Candelaria pacifica]
MSEMAESSTEWFPRNPHTARIKVHDRLNTTDEEAPIARVLTFPIEDGHPFIGVWETIRSDVHKVLEDAGLEWNTISVLRRRQSTQQLWDDTTIVITALRSAWGLAWEDAMRKVHDKTSHGTYGSKVWVELRAEGFSRFPNDAPAETEAPLSEFHLHDKKPVLGQSIGVKNLAFSSGTMGGFVELVDETGKSGTIICIMSNHHVIRPTKTKIAEGQNSTLQYPYDSQLDIMDRFHPAVSPGSSPALPISQPSHTDHKRTLRLYAEQTGDAQKSVEQLRLKASMKDRRSELYLPQAETAFKSLQSEYDRIQQFDIDFGTVWASSGYIKSPRTNGQLDWGLVQVRKDRIGNNSLVPIKNTAEDLKAEGAFSTMPKICSIRDSLDLDLHEHKRFAQVGKRTGVTFGTMNRIRTDVKAREIPGETMREIIIVGDKGKAFCVGGDSGALVFNQYGALAGQSYGGQDWGDLGTFVTPIDEIAASILELTGYRMRILNEA